MSRVFLLFNHDQSKIIAGTPNGSLKLMVDDIGLRIDAEAVDTETSKEVYQLAKSGLLDKMSFSFKLNENSFDFAQQDDRRRGRRLRDRDRLLPSHVLVLRAGERLHRRGRDAGRARPRQHRAAQAR